MKFSNSIAALFAAIALISSLATPAFGQRGPQQVDASAPPPAPAPRAQTPARRAPPPAPAPRAQTPARRAPPPAPNGWDRPAVIPSVNCGNRNQRFSLTVYDDFDPNNEDEVTLLRQIAQQRGFNQPGLSLGRLADLVVMQAIIDSYRESEGRARHSTIPNWNWLADGWWRRYDLRIFTVVTIRDVDWGRLCSVESTEVAADPNRFDYRDEDDAILLGIGVGMYDDQETHDRVFYFNSNNPTPQTMRGMVTTTIVVYLARYGNLGRLLGDHYIL